MSLASDSELLRRIQTGDVESISLLLARYREQLKQMIRLRIDPRLAPRVDPSDVVQETLLDAAAKLPAYATTQPLPLYPWLRELAWERMLVEFRRHVIAQRRTVEREQNLEMLLCGESKMLLAERLLAADAGPPAHLEQRERRDLVQKLIEQLDPRDRELILLRYVEQLSTGEIAAILQTTEGAIKMRHLRVIRRLYAALGDLADEC